MAILHPFEQVRYLLEQWTTTRRGLSNPYRWAIQHSAWLERGVPIRIALSAIGACR